MTACAVMKQEASAGMLKGKIARYVCRKQSRKNQQLHPNHEDTRHDFDSEQVKPSRGFTETSRQWIINL